MLLVQELGTGWELITVECLMLIFTPTGQMIQLVPGSRHHFPDHFPPLGPRSNM